MEQNINRNIDPYINGSGNVSGHFERDSWKEMIQRFYVDVTHLMEKEGQLIRAEMSEKIADVKTASVSLVTGGVLLFVGVLCLAATAIIALDIVTELWIAASIVTVAFLAIGGIMLAGAKKKLEADKLKPNRSIEAFGEIRHTLKEKVNEFTRN